MQNLTMPIPSKRDTGIKNKLVFFNNGGTLLPMLLHLMSVTAPILYLNVHGKVILLMLGFMCGQQRFHLALCIVIKRE